MRFYLWCDLRWACASSYIWSIPFVHTVILTYLDISWHTIMVQGVSHATSTTSRRCLIVVLVIWRICRIDFERIWCLANLQILDVLSRFYQYGCRILSSICVYVCAGPGPCHLHLQHTAWSIAALLIKSLTNICSFYRILEHCKPTWSYTDLDIPQWPCAQ